MLAGALSCSGPAPEIQPGATLPLAVRFERLSPECRQLAKTARPRKLTLRGPDEQWNYKCDPWGFYTLPAPVSGRSLGTGRLRAGFARFDITPPPGLSTLGWGTEAMVAAGHRNRLQVRVMVLESGDGETVALAVADLDFISAVLHRLVAEEVSAATQGALGADRIFLSATHTHSGPGHFSDSWALNLVGGAAPGFEDGFVLWLTGRIAEAIDSAHARLTPARAAWTVAPVWGYTRNRAYGAHLLNERVPDLRPAPPPGLKPEYAAVDPRWWMLRVDAVDPAADTLLRPLGAFSIFAAHGTLIPSGTDLYDSDLQGVVSRLIDDGLRNDFVHVLANGPEGDVSPDWHQDSRCRPPAMGRHDRPRGPRTPEPMIAMRATPAQLMQDCMGQARKDVARIARALADSAIAMHGRTRPLLTTGDFPVARSFTTLTLTTAEARAAGLCDRPQVGTSLPAGGVDGPTRIDGWKLFGVIPLGIERGGHAIDTESTSCQRPKRVALPFLQSPVVGRHQFAEKIQLAVLRLGNVTAGTVPAEPTTVTGLRMAEHLREALGRVRQRPVHRDSIAVIALVNGYLNYITTPEEYATQGYEGGATLYGPRESVVLAEALGTLAGSLGQPLPEGAVGQIVVRPGPFGELLPKNEPEGGDPPGVISCSLVGDTVLLRWRDRPSGGFDPHTGEGRGLVPARGRLVRFVRAGADAASAEDDDLSVEVRWNGAGWPATLWKTPHWEARWLPPGGVRTGVITARLLQHGIESRPCR